MHWVIEAMKSLNIQCPSCEHVLHLRRALKESGWEIGCVNPKCVNYEKMAPLSEEQRKEIFDRQDLTREGRKYTIPALILLVIAFLVSAPLLYYNHQDYKKTEKEAELYNRLIVGKWVHESPEFTLELRFPKDGKATFRHLVPHRISGGPFDGVVGQRVLRETESHYGFRPYYDTKRLFGGWKVAGPGVEISFREAKVLTSGQYRVTVSEDELIYHVTNANGKHVTDYKFVRIQ
jgi:hypothetical protein